MTLVAVLVAAVAAYIAWGQWRDQARPFVVVDLEPSEAWGNVINLVIENVGKTLATDVRMEFDPPMTSSMSNEQGYRFAEAPLFKNGIPSMPPGRRFEALFDLSHKRLEAGLPMTFKVKVQCKDARGKQQPELEYLVDLSFRYDLRRTEIRTLHHVAKNLEDILRLLRDWSAGSQGLRVLQRDAKEYQRELEEEWLDRVQTIDDQPSTSMSADEIADEEVESSVERGSAKAPDSLREHDFLRGPVTSQRLGPCVISNVPSQDAHVPLEGTRHA